jgi:hypothetical protein
MDPNTPVLFIVPTDDYPISFDKGCEKDKSADDGVVRGRSDYGLRRLVEARSLNCFNEE